jgi:hypothetical protein
MNVHPHDDLPSRDLDRLIQSRRLKPARIVQYPNSLIVRSDTANDVLRPIGAPTVGEQHLD